MTHPHHRRPTRPLVASVVPVLLAALLAALLGVTGFGLTTAPADAMSCRPVPPEYPGCTPLQARPATIDLAVRQYRGVADHYAYVRWGQHRHGVIWQHLRPRLNHRLARQYAALVRRARVTAGDRTVTLDYPTWRGFKAHTIAACTSYQMSRFPNLYCSAIVPKHPQDSSAGLRHFLHALKVTTHLVSRCNGEVVAGAVAGGAIAWWTGAGVLAGGAVGGTGGEVGCQVRHFYDWAFG